MKFTLSWLKDHLDTKADLKTILDALTDIGLEVEGVRDPAAEMALFRVADVLEAQPHPDADKLRVCKVRAITQEGEEELQVVCGAPNARAGMKAVFAPVGSYLPAVDLTLTKAKIRGVESFGMLASERELGLSDEHDGIIDLPADTPFGTPAAEIFGLDDPVIEIAITPNRPDCLGVRGIARDLAARGLGTLKADPVKPVKAAHDEARVITTDAAAACPVFAGRLVTGVKNGESPDWLKKRLEAIGLRPISALVDITNYISYDRGRPLHVYDADTLTGAVSARLAKAGERFTALDEKDYELTPEDCVIADEAGVLGLGGVMGGLASGSTETTQNVLIESAWFEPVRIAMTGRHHQIESDARYRFERGVDPQSVLPGLEQATQMVLELCGGVPGPVTVGGDVPNPAMTISFRTDRVQELTGMVLTETRIADILRALGFGVELAGEGRLTVQVPSWRPDIHGTADLVEEVARIEGLDRIPATPLPVSSKTRTKITTPSQDRRRWARRALASRGLHEAVTWSFMAIDHAKLFGGDNGAIRLVNPISSELDTMRPSIIANLAQAAGRNVARGTDDIGLFEVGPQFQGDQPADQQIVAALVRRGTTGGRHWSGSMRPVDWADVKADALAVLDEAGASVGSVQITADAPGWYHPGRSGAITLGPKRILAHFGELHPAVLKALDIKGSMMAAEIYLDAVPDPKQKPTKSKGALDASDFQPVWRDFAFVVDQSVEAGKLLKAIAGADKALITDTVVFDVYQGPGLEETEKSVAIAVRMQAGKTLTDQEIEAAMDKIVKAAEKSAGARLRS